MYLLTFVGRLVNMVTLLIMAWVVAFSWPRIYQDNQTKIDEALAPIKVKVEELTSKLPQLTAAKKEDWSIETFQSGIAHKKVFENKTIKYDVEPGLYFSALITHRAFWVKLDFAENAKTQFFSQ